MKLDSKGKKIDDKRILQIAADLLLYLYFYRKYQKRKQVSVI